MNICSMVWGCYIMSNYKIYGLTFGYDDKFLSLIVGNIACFGNGLFRYFFGIMYDKFGFRKCYNFHLIINMITIITLPMVAHLKFMYTLWIFFSAIGEGSIYVLFSA
jgi:MFS family permease